MVASTVHLARDQRIVAREAGTLAAAGYRTVVVARGEPEVACAPNLEFIALPDVSTRVGRVLRLQPLVARSVIALRPRVLHVHDPELIPLALLVRLWGTRAVYDAHESLDLDIDAKEWIPGPLKPIATLGAGLLLAAADHLDAVVAATPAIAASFASEVAVVENYPPLADFADVVPALDGRCVLYIGGLQRIRGIGVLIDAVEQVPGLRVILAGAFTEPQFEAELRRRSGWSRVEFVGWQDRRGLARLASRSTIGVVPLSRNPNYEMSLPTKMFEYMAAGLPVVSTDLPVAKDILDSTGAGLVVPASDPRALAQTISTLIEDPSRARRMGEAGRRAVSETYNWERSAAELRRLYLHLVPDSHQPVAVSR
jgi:glycosyltransferase involved in cell wall biosynthesis